jgi:hypothetical protein
MDTVKLISVGSAFEANLIKGQLEAQGISCVLHNEITNQTLKGYLQIDVDIFVYEKDYERASQIVDSVRPEKEAKPVSRKEIVIGTILLAIIAIGSIIYYLHR